MFHAICLPGFQRSSSSNTYYPINGKLDYINLSLDYQIIDSSSNTLNYQIYHHFLEYQSNYMSWALLRQDT
jgi:flagellar basal body rod protein FlgB